MNRHRITVMVGLALLLVAVAGWYRFYGPVGTTATRTSQSGKATAGGDAAVPVTLTLAHAENFAIRRRTIGILELPATVVVKSRLESQVTEQHVKDGQLVQEGRPAVHSR